MSRAWEDDRIIRVNMTEQSVSIEPFPQELKLLGGRALSARILSKECAARCDPLGPDNVLVLAPGVLSGTVAPTSGRISVGCKSPLTGGIKEANAGGEAGADLMRLGYRLIIVTGQPADRDRRWGLEVTTEGVKILPADEYKGMWNYACCEKLLANYPGTASAISIGPAGEMLMKGASVACTDRSKNRRPTRHAARGGVGAVMGSKGLKWVAIDAAKLPKRQPVETKAFSVYIKTFSKDYLGGHRHEAFKWGTSATVPVANMINSFPYKNRTEGQNPEFEKLDGARIRESFDSRGGGMHACMTGCIVRCSNVVHDKDGSYVTSALEFETLTLLGSCCAINDWEAVADLDRLCDELGLDTIETGGAIAVLMDSGGMEWGDAQGAKKLLREGITGGDKVAQWVGNGAVAVGKGRKHKRVPAAKGQALPAWEPRSLKATGITYCSSAMGGDHTAGLIADPVISGEPAVIASQEIQIINAICDSTGFCMFLGPTINEQRLFLGFFYGEDVTREQLADIGWQCLEDEWAFNDAAGFTAADDVLSWDMLEEGIGPEKSLVFDVSAQDIARVKVRFPASEKFYDTSPAG